MVVTQKVLYLFAKEFDRLKSVKSSLNRHRIFQKKFGIKVCTLVIFADGANFGREKTRTCRNFYPRKRNYQMPANIFSLIAPFRIK